VGERVDVLEFGLHVADFVPGEHVVVFVGWQWHGIGPELN